MYRQLQNSYFLSMLQIFLNVKLEIIIHPMWHGFMLLLPGAKYLSNPEIHIFDLNITAKKGICFSVGTINRHVVLYAGKTSFSKHNLRGRYWIHLCSVYGVSSTKRSTYVKMYFAPDVKMKHKMYGHVIYGRMLFLSAPPFKKKIAK